MAYVDQPERDDGDELTEILVIPDDGRAGVVIEIAPGDQSFEHYPPARVTLPTFDASNGKEQPRDYLLTGALDREGRRVYRSRRH